MAKHDKKAAARPARARAEAAKPAAGRDARRARSRERLAEAPAAGPNPWVLGGALSVVLAGTCVGAWFYHQGYRDDAAAREITTLVDALEEDLKADRLTVAARRLQALDAYGDRVTPEVRSPVQTDFERRRDNYLDRARAEYALVRTVIDEALRARDAKLIEQARDRLLEDVRNNFPESEAHEVRVAAEQDRARLEDWLKYLSALAQVRQQLDRRDYRTALDILAPAARLPIADPQTEAGDPRAEAAGLRAYYEPFADAHEALADALTPAAVETAWRALARCRTLEAGAGGADPGFAELAQRLESRLLDQGALALDAADYDAAEAQYQDARRAAEDLGLDPEDADAGVHAVGYQRAFAAGTAALAAQDFDAAIEQFRLALGHRRDDPAALAARDDARFRHFLARADAAEAQQDWAGARAELTQAREVGPNRAELDDRIERLILRETLDEALALAADDRPADERLAALDEKFATLDAHPRRDEFADLYEQAETLRATLRAEAAARAAAAAAVAYEGGFTFRLGRHDSQWEATGPEVTLPSFAIARREVSNEEFAAFVADDGYTTEQWWDAAAWTMLRDRPAAFAETGGAPGPARFRNGRPPAGEEDWPVVGISWYEADAWCRWKSAEAGRRYRLPTEAEWEFACRGGAATRFPWGSDDPNPDFVYAGKDADAPFSPVGAFADEGLHPAGLCHMLGNAAEWTADWFAPYGAGYPPAAGRVKVVRGGSLRDPAERCTPTARAFRPPLSRPATVGFRWVREG